MFKNSYSSLLVLVTVLFFSSAFTTANPSTAISHNGQNIDAANKWEKLGQRRVNYGLDRDEIFVTARDGAFRALKLKVRNGGVNLHRCVVHFRNGQTQSLNIAQNLARGSETRVLNLNGNRRIITKVVFWYDTKNHSQRRGLIELWGRH